MQLRKCAVLAVSALSFFMLGVLSAGSAAAQDGTSESDDEWQYSAAVYLWAADVGGRTTTGSTVEVDFSDILDNLEGAFLGAFEARKGKWSFLTDALYLDIAATSDVPIGPGSTLTSNVSLDLTTKVFHLVGGYNLWAEGQSRLDFIAGVRNLDLDTDLVLNVDVPFAPQPPPIVASASDNAVDFIIGLKGNIALSERWFLPYYVDIGGGDSDSTWQATVGLGFRAGRWIDLALVYRHVEWSFDSTQSVDSLDFSGPTFGAIFRF
jgi:hypothetical protein